MRKKQQQIIEWRRENRYLSKINANEISDINDCLAILAY